MTDLKFNLKNKTSLITGAAGMLGEQHARALLEIGSRVILTDMNIESLNIVKENLRLEYAHEKILALKMDVLTLLQPTSTQMQPVMIIHALF